MNVLVIGDAIMDKYVYCGTERVSAEAPIPIFYQIKETTSPGGVYNVYENLKALGCRPDIMTGSTSFKTRYVCDNKIVFRCDDDATDSHPTSSFKSDKHYDYVVLVDYLKGTITAVEDLIEYYSARGSRVIVDTKGVLQECSGAWMVKMNKQELKKSGVEGYEALDVLKYYDIENLVVTAGSDGIYTYSKDGSVGHFPTEKVEVADVTGAGDVVTAGIVSALAAGKDMATALHQAATLATISVTHFGTYKLTAEDIAKARPKIVFTNGCFDVLHRGHIELLKKSRDMGDRLVVGINSDESVKRLKGACRPINDQESRKAALEAIKWVDEVVIFDEDTPLELIKNVQPSIITKGGDYDESTVVGRELAEVRIIPLVKGFSTTEIVEKMRDE